MDDTFLRFQLDLLRLEAGTVRKVLPILNDLERELRGRLAGEDLTRYSKTRLAALLADAKRAIADYYGKVQVELFPVLEGVAQSSAAATVAAFATDIALAPEPYLAALANNAIIQGATQSAWWGKQAADMSFRFNAAVRTGLAAGDTNAAIIARVADTFNLARKNAAALVQTGVQTVANEARLAVFEQNADIVTALKWLSALDSHVCPICAARADKTWETVSKAPIGHSVPWRNAPIHFNDRCVITPVTRASAAPGGARASSAGPVARSTTFAEFLDRQGAAFQNEVLGKGRAEMWRAGKITLDDLINGRGRPLTLEQLRERHG